MIFHGDIDDSPIPNSSIGVYLYKRLLHHKGKVALILPADELQITYDQIIKRTSIYYRWLSQFNLKRGDVVAVCYHFHADYIPTMMANLLHGFLTLPINPGYEKVDLLLLLELTKPRLIIVVPSTEAIITNLAKKANIEVTIFLLSNTNDIKLRHQEGSFRVYDEPGWENEKIFIIGSSGSSGLPLAVTYTNSMIHYYLLERRKCKFGITPGDTYLQTSPVYWITSLRTTLLTLDNGNTVIVLIHGTSTSIFQAIQDYKVSIAWMLPSSAVTLATSARRREYNLSNWNILGLCGQPVRAEMVVVIEMGLGVQTIVAYGLTEVILVCVSSYPIANRNTVGKLIANLSGKVIDLRTKHILEPMTLGEIVLRAPLTQPRHYHPIHERALTDDEGWFYTGDYGYIDEEGYFYVLDRISDLVNYRGIPVSVTEIELLLTMHPAVREAVVVARKDREDGQHPVAFIIRFPCVKVEEAAFIQLVEENLPEPSWLRGGVVFVERVPKTLTGKVRRSALRLYLEKFQRRCSRKQVQYNSKRNSRIS